MHLSLKIINYLIISLVAFCILSISSLSIYQNYSMLNTLDNFYEHPFTVISSVTTVRKNSRTLWDYTNEAIFLKKELSKTQIEELEKEIELNLEIVNKQYLGPHSDYENLERTYKFHKESINNIFLLIEKNEIDKAKNSLSTTNYHQLIDNVEKIIRFAQNKALTLKNKAHNQLIDFRDTLLIVSIIISLFGIIISILTLKFIHKRFLNLKTSLNSINHNNFKPIDINKNDIQDFIDIQSSINLMTKRLDSSNKEILALKLKYQVLFDNSPDAYFIMEINAGEIIDCNDTALKMLRGNRSQIIGLTPDKLSCEYQPDGKLSKDAVQDKIAQALKDGITRFEWLHKRVDGELFWAEIIASVVKIEGILVLFVTWRDIDEIKKLGQIVQDEKQRYKAIMDLASDGIHIIDVDGNVINYSSSFSKMLGYSDEEMSTLNIIDWEVLIKPEDVKNLLTSLIDNPRFLETKYKRKDGTIFDVEINAKGIEIDNKTYLYASARDVSDKKEFERNLKKSESKFHTLVEESLDGIVLLDLQTQHFIEFNKKTLEMYGYTQDEFLKLKPKDLDVIHNQEQILKTQQNIITKGWDRFETKHKTKEGKILDISVSARKIDIDEQAFLYVSFHDITEQKNIESLILSQKEEFESLFRQSGEGIAILDLDSKFLDFNDAYIKMLGYTSEELKMKSCIELSAPEDREKSIEALSIAFSQGYLQNFEKICITKEGKRLDVSMTATLLSDKQRFLIVTKDMTSFKLIEEQYRLASMGEMIGNIAHQWRQPLSVISSIASGIKVMDEFNILDKHEILPDMEKIIQQTEYLSRTIDDFRNYIKDSGDSKELNIKDILEKALLILHPAIVNSYVKIIKNISCDIKVEVNENELVQSFINIINNARDAIQENVQENEDRYIFITMDKNIDNIKELTICDTGGGIPQNVINRIFEPYFTTKHQSVGTGLGLSITHKIIVEKYKFNLNVLNKEIEHNGKKYYGACFIIQFKDN